MNKVKNDVTLEDMIADGTVSVLPTVSTKKRPYTRHPKVENEVKTKKSKAKVTSKSGRRGKVTSTKSGFEKLIEFAERSQHQSDVMGILEKHLTAIREELSQMSSETQELGQNVIASMLDAGTPMLLEYVDMDVE